MSKLLFGWAEIDITPCKRVSLAGQFAERISEYVEKPLTATALAIAAGEEQAVIVSADLLGVACNLVEAIRKNLEGNAAGLDPMKVVFAATHTHTGPVYPRHNRTNACTNSSNPFRTLLEEQLPPGKKYVESANVSNNPEIATNEEIFNMLADRLSRVAIEAWNNRKPGAYSNAFGRAVVGHCRRATYSDGSAKMWGETNTAFFEALEGGSDSGIELLYIHDENGKLAGIVANVACPAQCVQHRHFVSPDYWGETKMLLREYFGKDLYLLPLCSAAGDQCPIDLIRWVEPESDVNDPNIKHSHSVKRKADPSMFDLAGMRKAGKRVAKEIISVYEEGLDPFIADAEFEHHAKMLQLPLRRATFTDVTNARRAIQEYISNVEGDVNYSDSAMLQVHLGILVRAQVQEKMDIVDSEVHIIRLGSIAIATSPFEPFLDYGNQIRARSLAEQTFLVQLACGTENYLPTERAEQGGHYSGFISSGLVGHVGGELLVRQTLEEINTMFAQ